MVLKNKVSIVSLHQWTIGPLMINYSLLYFPLLNLPLLYSILLYLP